MDQYNIMAQLIIVYWRDIPAQVICKKGRRDQVKLVLSERFEKAIDIAAMRGGARGEDSYLDDWRKSTPEEISDDIAMEATKHAAKIENKYDDARLKILMKNGGVEGK